MRQMAWVTYIIVRYNTICFHVILQETQTGETLKYCTISTLWNGNFCSNNDKYMRYILLWKFGELKAVPELFTTS